MVEDTLGRLLSRAQELEPGARYDEALQDLETVISEARQAGLSPFEAAALLHRGRLLRIKGQLDASEESARAAAMLFAEVGDRGGQARALLVVAEVLSDRALLSDFDRVSKQALALSQAAGDASAEARSHTLVAASHLYLGRPGEAAASCQLALGIYGAMQDRRGIAATQLLLSRAELSRGNIAAAVEANQAALSLFQDLGEQRALSSVLFNLGQMLYEREELSDARTYAERGVQLTSGSGDSAMAARHLLLRAQIDIELASFDQALEGLRQAQAIAQGHDLVSIVPEVDRTTAQALLGLGQTDEARAAAVRGVQGTSSDDPYSQGTATLVQALADVRTGAANDAERAFRAAMEYLEEAAEMFELGWGHREFGSFLMASGRPQEAREEFLRSKEAFERLQATARVARVDALLASLT